MAPSEQADYFQIANDAAIGWMREHASDPGIFPDGAWQAAVDAVVAARDADLRAQVVAWRDDAEQDMIADKDFKRYAWYSSYGRRMICDRLLALLDGGDDADGR